MVTENRKTQCLPRAGALRQPGVTAVVVSGGNIDLGLHARLIRGEPVEFEG